MNETTVALTDYVLAGECTAFAALVARGYRASSERTLWLTFFGSTAFAALAGGTVHGFFASATSGVGPRLWTATMLAIGVTGWSVLGLAACLAFHPRLVRLVTRVGAVELAGYAIVVLFVTQDYWLALAQYAPFGAFWLAALGREYLRTRDRATLVGLIGLGSSFVAAVIQFFRIAITSIRLDHNSLYHLVQMIGLALLFTFARARLTACDAPAREHRVIGG
jgi:hypothetical protein